MPPIPFSTFGDASTDEEFRIASMAFVSELPATPDATGDIFVLHGGWASEGLRLSAGVAELTTVYLIVDTVFSNSTQQLHLHHYTDNQHVQRWLSQGNGGLDAPYADPLIHFTCTRLSRAIDAGHRFSLHVASDL